MAHQESVLSPETDLLIQTPARPYTAPLMILVCESAVPYMCASFRDDFYLEYCG